MIIYKGKKQSDNTAVMCKTETGPKNWVKKCLPDTFFRSTNNFYKRQHLINISLELIFFFNHSPQQSNCWRFVWAIYNPHLIQPPSKLSEEQIGKDLEHN